MDSGQNNTFGSPAPGGDIILSGNVEPKKSKKGLIVSLVLAGVLAIVAVVLGVMNLGGGQGGGGNNTSLKEAFNRYANYALYGTDSTAEIEGDVEAMLEYAFVEGQDENFSFEKMKSLFEEFTEEASKEDEYDLDDSILYTKNALLLLGVLREVKPYTNSDLLEMLLADGYETAVQNVNGHYEKFEQSGSSRAKTYAEAKKEYDKVLLYRHNEYLKNGCIKDAQIDSSCAKAVVFDDGHNDDVLKKYMREANRYYTSLDLDYAGLIFQLRNIIYNEDEEGEI